MDAADRPTWHADVAPLLADRCGACHVDGGIGPFGVADYDAVVPWGPAIAASVADGRMPPFFAAETDECAMPIGFLDDVRLTPEERALVGDWVDAGMPEGDPEAAAPAPLRTVDHLEEPDAVLSLPEPFTVSGQRDIYRCFRIEVGNTRDIWIDGVEVLPDNELVVHHVLVWNDPGDLSAAKAGPDGSYRCSGQPDVWPSELVAAWTPGGSPSRSPAGAGTLFHPGAVLVVNVHYHPTGATSEVDQTSVALTWLTEPPAQHATWYLMDLPFGAQTRDGQFAIPAGEASHRETMVLTVPDQIPFDLSVFAITPHMHYLGTGMRVTVASGGDETCLIHTPGYRFDFQTSYVYDPATGTLPTIRPGDIVRVRCTYDNTEGNPFLADQLDAAGWDAPGTVHWGEETGDEMCMAMVGLLIPPIDWLAVAGGLF